MISFSISSRGRTSPAPVSIESVPWAGSGAIGISLPETIAGTGGWMAGETISGSGGRLGATGGRGGSRGGNRGETRKSELIALAHDDGPIDRVLKLTDVAGPIELRQIRHRLAR